LATLDNALASCERFTLSKASACAVIAEVWRVVREWRAHFEELDVPAAEQDKIAPAFRHLDDISTRELRRQLP
jgi:serine/threonine-protein kinase HipA